MKVLKYIKATLCFMFITGAFVSSSNAIGSFTSQPAPNNNQLPNNNQSVDNKLQSPSDELAKIKELLRNFQKKFNDDFNLLAQNIKHLNDVMQKDKLAQQEHKKKLKNVLEELKKETKRLEAETTVNNNPNNNGSQDFGSVNTDESFSDGSANTSNPPNNNNM